MKKYILLLLLLITNITIYAQSYHTTKGYVYSHLLIQQVNGKTDFDEAAIGCIIFGTKGGKELVGVSLDRETIYQGYITKKEKGWESGSYLVSYEFTTYLHGISVPIVLSEIYDTPNSIIPKCFFLTVLNRYTKKPVRYNIFSGITKPQN